MANADSEILALNSFDPSNTAIVDKGLGDKSDNDSLDNLNYKDNDNSKISLIEYKPNYLKYSSNSKKDGIAIFSEIFMIKDGMYI